MRFNSFKHLLKRIKSPVFLDSGVHVKNFEVYCGLFVVIQIQKHKTGSKMSISIVSLRINKDAKNLSFSLLQHENVKTSTFVSSFRHNQ